jgi:hypothetical protein
MPKLSKLATLGVLFNLSELSPLYKIEMTVVAIHGAA